MEVEKEKSSAAQAMAVVTQFATALVNDLPTMSLAASAAPKASLEVDDSLKCDQ
jgi:hypothetical protein